MSSLKKIAIIICLCFLFIPTFILSTWKIDSRQVMYCSGKTWAEDDFSFTYLSYNVEPSYKTLSGEVIYPDVDSKFIVVECDTNLDDSSILKSSYVTKNESGAPSYPLFREPIILYDNLSQNKGNCILLFSVPDAVAKSDLTFYTMEVETFVNYRVSHKQFAFCC